MIKIEKAVFPSPAQWEITIEGMRNSYNSWDKMDSYTKFIDDDCEIFHMGDNDFILANSLSKKGCASHAKFRRMLPVVVTVTAPAFWWTEADTYKVGTVRNSCSKMHKIHVSKFTLDDFSHEACEQIPFALGAMSGLIQSLEWLRGRFNESQDKQYWRAIIELLPHGYNMRATLSLNYEVLANIYSQRKNHKLDEWREFCEWIEDIPYAELVTECT